MTLLSTEFVAIALAACIGLPLLRGRLRGVFFLALNVWFVSSFLPPAGMISTALFLLLGYGVATWAAGGGGARVGWGAALMTAVFVYLRGYDLVRLALPDGWVHDVLATAGLSFLLFKMLHVIVDAGAGTVGDLRFGRYVNYCLNFTTFLLGPIQRYQDFDEQWTGRKPSMSGGFEAHLDAITRIVRGLVKKFVLAEYLFYASLHSGVDFGTLGNAELLTNIYVFYLYLYCDFAGYCDIVIGIGQLMGIRPPENFDLPFLSRNVSDYWLRVHRSLTEWLTDYVFNPVFAGSLRSSLLRGKTFTALALALLVTMFVSGLWHGTTMAFLLFGLLHGVYLVIHRAYEHLGRKWLGRKKFRAWTKHWAVHAASVILTYNVTSLAYVLFVLDLSEVRSLAERMLGW